MTRRATDDLAHANERGQAAVFQILHGGPGPLPGPEKTSGDGTRMPAFEIPLTPVASSNLQAIGYDPETKQLDVQFASGHIYRYANVSGKTAAALEAAPSKGSFYAHEIKGQHVGEKVTGTCEACGDIGYLGRRCTDCGTGTYTLMRLT